MSDKLVMNISGGISEIKLPGLDRNKKIWTWPAYNQGKINKISRLQARNDQRIIYSNTSSEEKERLIDSSVKNSHVLYSREGGASIKFGMVPPGSLFNAKA